MKNITLNIQRFLYSGLFAFLISTIILLPTLVLAAVGDPSGGSTADPGGVRSFQVNNPLNFSSVSSFMEALLRAVIAIGIPIAVLFVVWAGLKFVTAQGNAEELKAARKNFVWTIVGIAIFLGAALLAQLIKATLQTVGVNI